MSNSIKIAIAEDHQLVRKGFVSILSKYDNFEVLFDVGNGKELLDQMESDILPDVILLDLRMPVMDGHQTYRKLKEHFPQVKVLILSSLFSEAYVVEFIHEGAAGFLPKNCEVEQLITAIEQAHELGYYRDTTVSNMVDSVISGRTLFNERQMQVLRLLSEEKNIDEIADHLSITRRTVEWHKQRLFEKTQTDNVVGLLKYARANGILTHQ